MRCSRCNSLMFIMEHIDQPLSTQTWYQCTACRGQRLLSADRERDLLAPDPSAKPQMGQDPYR